MKLYLASCLCGSAGCQKGCQTFAEIAIKREENCNFTRR